MFLLLLLGLLFGAPGMVVSMVLWEVVCCCGAWGALGVGKLCVSDGGKEFPTIVVDVSRAAVEDLGNV